MAISRKALSYGKLEKDMEITYCWDTWYTDLFSRTCQNSCSSVVKIKNSSWKLNKLWTMTGFGFRQVIGYERS